MPIHLAHAVTRQLTRVRKDGILPYVRPDGKSQVTVEYRDGKPYRVDKVVVSTQHHPDAALALSLIHIFVKAQHHGAHVLKPFLVQQFQ